MISRASRRRAGDDALGLALGLAAVVVGLLLGEAQDLLDAGAETGQRRAAALLELLAGVGELLLDGGQALLGLAQPALAVVETLLGLGPRLLGLRQRGVEAGDVVVDLRTVVATQDDAELSAGVGGVEEGSRSSAGPCRTYSQTVTGRLRKGVGASHLRRVVTLRRYAG